MYLLNKDSLYMKSISKELDKTQLHINISIIDSGSLYDVL